MGTWTSRIVRWYNVEITHGQEREDSISEIRLHEMENRMIQIQDVDRLEVEWAKENEIDENGNTIEDYSCFEDYLEDNGLNMLQGGLENRLKIVRGKE